jgi:hypothetical protein
MDWAWPLDIMFLGAGGKEPRFDALMGSGETRRLLEFPPMHSAYAISIESEGGSIAVGTKGGLVYILSGYAAQKADAPARYCQLAQGAPVLSACWICKSLLAVSDTARRCLLWDTIQKEFLQSLETGGETICSLVNLTDGLLAGLSTNGKLLFWQPREGRLVKKTDGPPPPITSALVQMVYWPAQHALAYPARNGNLTLVSPEKNAHRELTAHRGAFYAISAFGENLLTVGKGDGRIKVWEAGPDKPRHDFQGVEEVISAAALGNQPTKLLLVDARGIANAFTLEDGEFRHLGRVPGEDYRAAVVPSPERIQALYAKRQEEEVRRIVSEIQEGVERVPGEDITRLHSRLTELGYEHVSLALRAEQAEKNGKIIEALEFYFGLVRILPQDNPSIFAFMERYAASLKKAWHLPEADAVRRRILDFDPNYQFNACPNNLGEAADLVRGENWVIEPDIPMEDVIESANVIGKRLIGRYAMRLEAPQSCCRVLLTPEMIAEKYERVRRESGKKRLPGATTERVWWISREEYDEVQLVPFGDGATNTIKGLQFAVQVSCVELDTVVTPVVLFDWRAVLPGETVEEGNKRASEALKHIKKKSSSNPYLSAVHVALEQALERLVTQKRSQREIHR